MGQQASQRASEPRCQAGSQVVEYMGGCQNFGPFLDPYYNTAPNITGTPKRDHNSDNHPHVVVRALSHCL